MPGGEALRELRGRLAISTREVQDCSRKIAQNEDNEEFYISNSRLTQIETTGSVPSIHKLFSLSVIYKTGFSELLSIFGVNLAELVKYQSALPPEKTCLTKLERPDPEGKVTFPVRLDPGFSIERSNLLSRMVEVWGEVPIPLIQGLDLRHGLYGYIGFKDFTLYPLLRPGSFVQIDDRLQQVKPGPWRSEFERPIYFIELREGYACSWCELNGRRLVLVPHPLSPCTTREFNFPDEAEIVGQVTAVAARVVNYSDDPSCGTLKLPKRV